MVRLTQHFVDNWKARVGGEPTLAMVQQVIDESVKVQPTRNLFASRGYPYRVLAIYCNFERKLLIKVDEVNGNAVTVMGVDNGPMKTMRRRDMHDQS